jgi:hypothetical protein
VRCVFVILLVNGSTARLLLCKALSFFEDTMRFHTDKNNVESLVNLQARLQVSSDELEDSMVLLHHSGEDSLKAYIALAPSSPSPPSHEPRILQAYVMSPNVQLLRDLVVLSGNTAADANTKTLQARAVLRNHRALAAKSIASPGWYC